MLIHQRLLRDIFITHFDAIAYSIALLSIRLADRVFISNGFPVPAMVKPACATLNKLLYQALPKQLSKSAKFISSALNVI
ncbi:hypothetical protein [Coleofasciculus sp. FACHB-1120]|uniref:hypothetical protein n=1 Tax=Coleofasciculus sp. FACHB-1120 TaxID=2692783 RepID=UPI00168303DF|nr:hypothetical protein [Coleofasciculus sp. FACHB-1120]MBD2741635.1 hypothetical protein [Coleofasciculus sp. FACHB-1120]